MRPKHLCEAVVVGDGTPLALPVLWVVFNSPFAGADRVLLDHARIMSWSLHRQTFASVLPGAASARTLIVATIASRRRLVAMP